MSLLAQGYQQHGPATRPAVSGHTLDGSACPTSRWRLLWTSQLHPPSYCPPTAPVLGVGSDSHHHRHTPAGPRASAWPL